MSIPNRGTAGAVLDTTNNGLVRVEGGAVRFPTTAAQLQSPYNTSLALSGEEFESVVRASVDNYVNVPLLSRYDFSASGRSWTFCVAGNGNLILSITPDGTHASKIGYQSSATPASVIPAGTSGWWKATFVGDNGNGNSEVNFYWAPDQLKEPTEWNALGGPVQGSVTTVAPGTAPLGVNTNDGSMGTPGLRWTLFRGILRDGVGGATLFDFDGEADISDPAATSFVCSTGQTLTVNRAASGPVTTLVPAGTVVYINPDAGAATRLQTAGANQTFDVASGEDLIVAWCGQPGPQPPGLFGVPFRSSASGDRVDLQRRDTGQAPGQGAKSVVVVGNVSLDGGPANLPAWPFPTVVHFLVLNKATGLAQQYVFDEAGIVSKPAATSIANMGAMVAVAAMQMMQHLTGTFSSALWKVGVGIAPSDTELASIAAALLAKANRRPTYTIGALPPAGHKVRGDTFTANNGHKAQFDGALWQPVTPATGNIAALLGNNQLLLGAS
jgi:hypothetical protein